MSHHCHATGCTASVPPSMWGCAKHWYMVPKPIRDRVWATYRPGQEHDKNPSVEYLHAAREAVIAVARREGREPDTSVYDAFLRLHELAAASSESSPDHVDDALSRARRFKRMAERMAAMIDWPAEDLFVRTSGQCVCEECGLLYFDHPQEGGLTLTCNGRLWKL